MKPLVTFDPFREMLDGNNRLARLLGLTPGNMDTGREMLTTTEWSPSVDIVEDAKEWLVKADLPEMKKEDMKVTVENGVLTMTGERKLEKEEKNKKYHRVERSYGSFLRSFTLPEEVDATKVAAETKDGVLTVHLPKSAKPAPKAVEVKAA
jgi:HSP20 family protein